MTTEGMEMLGLAIEYSVRVGEPILGDDEENIFSEWKSTVIAFIETFAENNQYDDVNEAYITAKALMAELTRSHLNTAKTRAAWGKSIEALRDRGRDMISEYLP